MDTSSTPQPVHPYLGLWVAADGRIRHELRPDGRYVEARGDREAAYVGTYEVDGDHIDYRDDTGFTADGDFRDDVLHHAGMVLHRRKVVLVTGASSGIGRATAVRLAAAGHPVVLGARRTDRLDELVTEIEGAGGTAMAVPLDVTALASVQEFAAAARARFGRIDVLVANAGVMPLSPLAAGLVDEWDRMIDVNVRGLLHSITATLPTMLAQGAGHVVTIASVGAYDVSPTAAVYCGTKFAARAITEGLRQESPRGIRVTTVSPGVTESELAATITDASAAAAMVVYRAESISADAIARAVSYAVAERPDVDVNEIVVRPAAQR
ncbi:SDR family NAD(P)-dependent oxidoreductase [Curtobacterium flaccumfaciens pv. flaccumfaciens]|uniref:SDR family NAD(P)-dependent oxidoreductase n=1 Tax=Curtobacterium flaccumfaciens TaxID=2035 RepID=UPI0021B0E773|nr:SDR family NAD(P)-dependent oxidoreductase [Curtobacterium flaccumfaciens]QYI97989.1 SDR family NAD(P)-dependent oxidoreductase [Curtobacterium flaccumfaciens pv. flaccumfaciens]UXN22199.1 SDR family NAD(P)-dependent oxidoreductase [Curtobacterium flaccumfaciens pv. flaccumfaciens]